jgi:hypothetical protein
MEQDRTIQLDGACHILWGRQQKILKEKYGINWRTPAEYRHYSACRDAFKLAQKWARMLIHFKRGFSIELICCSGHFDGLYVLSVFFQSNI